MEPLRGSAIGIPTTQGSRTVRHWRTPQNRYASFVAAPRQGGLGYHSESLWDSIRHFKLEALLKIELRGKQEPVGVAWPDATHCDHVNLLSRRQRVAFGFPRSRLVAVAAGMT